MMRQGEARQGRRRRAQRGHGGGDGVVLEEAEDDGDVPVTVDDADEEDQVDDLAQAYLTQIVSPSFGHAGPTP